MIVLVAGAAQNAMAGRYRTAGDGLLLVAVIIGWAYALDWLGYRIPSIQRFVHPPSLLLVRDGKPQLRNLRADLLTHEELMTHLRAQGVADISEVERAYLEGTGELTVVRKGGKESSHQQPRHRGA